MARMASSSSDGPQPKAQPPPPMAHAPNPTRVISGPALPSLSVGIDAIFSAPPGDGTTAGPRVVTRGPALDAIRLPAGPASGERREHRRHLLRQPERVLRPPRAGGGPAVAGAVRLARPL